MTRGQVILALIGMILFGLATFGIGVIVGRDLGRGDGGPQPGATGGYPATAVVAAPAQSPPSPGGADAPSPAAKPDSGAPAAAASAPEPAATSANGAAGGASAATAAAPAPAAAPVRAVSGFSSAPPLEAPVVSPLSGPLATAAAAPVLPPPVEPPPPKAAPGPHVFAVQAGRFLRREMADELADRLSGAGIAAEIVTTAHAGTAAWYVVILGEYADEATARRHAADVAGRTPVTPVVVTWARPGP